MQQGAIGGVRHMQLLQPHHMQQSFGTHASFADNRLWAVCFATQCFMLGLQRNRRGPAWLLNKVDRCVPGVHELCVLRWCVSVCREQHEHSSVVMDLLNRKTAKEQAKLEQYRSHGAAVQAQCEHMTKEACRQAHGAPRACHKMHKR